VPGPEPKAETDDQRGHQDQARHDRPGPPPRVESAKPPAPFWSFGPLPAELQYIVWFALAGRLVAP